MMFSRVDVNIAQPKNLELGCPTCRETEKLTLVEADGTEEFRCDKCGTQFAPEDMVLVDVR